MQICIVMAVRMAPQSDTSSHCNGNRHRCCSSPLHNFQTGNRWKMILLNYLSIRGSLRARCR